METRTVKLAFTGPVHFGRGRLSDGGCTCDAATLFSALYIEALHMGAGVADELLAAARSGALSISDAFPYIGETLYLPKPMLAADAFDARKKATGESGDSRERKANKKLAYVPVDRYADYLAGSFDSIRELGRFNLGASSLQTKVNLTRARGDDAEPYHVGGYAFEPGAGLYFLVQGSYDLAPILEQLGYSGIGGKRTSGYGRFTHRIEKCDPLRQVQRRAGVSASVLLATATPAESELDDGLLSGARYRLVRKGGFIQSTTHSATPQKKRDLYLFAAGSTFARTFAGDVFDVNATPGSHPVYRYARAMWMEV